MGCFLETSVRVLTNVLPFLLPINQAYHNVLPVKRWMLYFILSTVCVCVFLTLVPCRPTISIYLYNAEQLLDIPDSTRAVTMYLRKE